LTTAAHLSIANIVLAAVYSLRHLTSW
jgi:hypothetical protein